MRPWAKPPPSLCNNRGCFQGGDVFQVGRNAPRSNLAWTLRTTGGAVVASGSQSRQTQPSAEEEGRRRPWRCHFGSCDVRWRVVLSVHVWRGAVQCVCMWCDVAWVRARVGRCVQASMKHVAWSSSPLSCAHCPGQDLGTPTLPTRPHRAPSPRLHRQHVLP